MENNYGKVYGIGNPLIDVLVNISFEDLLKLGLHKGTMNLINTGKRLELSEFIRLKGEPVFSCGGSCPNTMITLAAMGVDVTIAGKIGKDEYGDIYNDNVNKLGIKNNLATSENPTGSSIILITPDSDRTMNTYLGANRDYCPDDVVEQNIASSDIFHFTGYMWDTKNQMEAVKKALKIAKHNNVKVTFDIADQFAVGRNRESFIDLLRNNCDVVFANAEEARMMCDNYDPLICCKTLGKLCETAVVKNGKRGSFISYHEKIYNIPVQGPSTPVDTTGAGDTYAAGYIYGLTRGYSVEDCGNIASLLAGQIIKQKGAQFSKEKADSLRTMLENKQWTL